MTLLVHKSYIGLFQVVDDDHLQPLLGPDSCHEQCPSCLKHTKTDEMDNLLIRAFLGALCTFRVHNFAPTKP